MISLRKLKKYINATKTPSHKISQNNIYHPNTFGVPIPIAIGIRDCVLAPKAFGVVAKKRLFGVDSIINSQSKIINQKIFSYLRMEIN